MAFLTNIANNLSSLWNKGTQAVGNEVQQLPHQIQQTVQPVQQNVNNFVQQVPQQAINFGNMASTFGQHLQQAVSNAPAPFTANRLSIGDVGNFAHQNFIQSPAQFGTGLALSARNAVTGENNPSYTPDNPVSKFLL